MTIKIIQEPQLDFSDVLVQPKRSFQLSRKDIQIERDFHFYHSPRVWNGFPLMISPMPYLANIKVGLAMAENHMITCLHKFHSNEELYTIFSEHQDKLNYLWCTTGITGQDSNKIINLFTLLENRGLKLPNLCVDAATAYSDFFIKQAAALRECFPEIIIMGGNCADGNIGVELIIYAKLDIVKVGIGPSRLCATRRVVGVGRSQLSAIMDTASHVHGLKSGPKKLGLICGDGGVNEIGDLFKGYGGGADFMMCASLFNGVEECSGTWENNKLKVYGLSSYEAQNQHYGGVKKYRSSEGECYWVESQGSIKNLIQQILGGARSFGTYINAPSIRDFSKCTTFYLVNRQK